MSNWKQNELQNQLKHRSPLTGVVYISFIKKKKNDFHGLMDSKKFLKSR